MTKTKRVQKATKQGVAVMIERYFAAKGYWIQRKRLVSRGPSHLRVWHNDKDREDVENDWDRINTFTMKEFGWVPDAEWDLYGNTLYILIGRI